MVASIDSSRTVDCDRNEYPCTVTVSYYMYANHKFNVATPTSTTEPHYMYAVHAKALCQIAELLPVAMLNTSLSLPWKRTSE